MSLSTFMKFLHRSLYQITLLFATEPNEVAEGSERVMKRQASW